jgi:hypothetical protein
MSDETTPQETAENETPVVETTGAEEVSAPIVAAPQFPTVEELTRPILPPHEHTVTFDDPRYSHLKFRMRRIDDATDLRDVANEAELLQAIKLKDQDGRDYNIDFGLAWTYSLLSASLVTPKMTPRQVLDASRVNGLLITALSMEASKVNGGIGRAVEVRKNS